MEWTLELPFTKPLSLNDRMHWRVKAKLVRQVRDAASVLCRQQKIPACTRIQVELHYTPRDRRVRDPLNLVATLKAVEDGIVDAGVVPGDDPRYVEPTMPKIDEANRSPRIYAIVRQLA